MTHRPRRRTQVPRQNAFTSLLQLASKSRQPEKAVELFEAMHTVCGLRANAFSYSALISALARVGQWYVTTFVTWRLSAPCASCH